MVTFFYRSMGFCQSQLFVRDAAKRFPVFIVVQSNIISFSVISVKRRHQLEEKPSCRLLVLASGS